MKRFAYLIALVAIFVAGPVFADKYFAVTPSGSAEIMFEGTPSEVVARLSGKCIDARWRVISSSPTELVCEAPLNAGQSFLGQLLLGNSYSTPPRRFFRFNLVNVGGVSRVQASGWMELQMAFGQIKRSDFSGPEFHNSILVFMTSAGGKYPVGTTFPNHAVLGIQGADVPQGKYIGLRITEIEPASSAARAGLQVGDVVTRIAGKQFKNVADYLDATAKAAETATYKVEISRSGTSMDVSVDRAFRAPVTIGIAAKPETPAAPGQAGAPLSVADELSKLAQLRKDGALTDAEFEAQKKKILAQ